MTDFGDEYRSVWGYLMQTALRQDYIQVAGVRTRYV